MRPQRYRATAVLIYRRSVSERRPPLEVTRLPRTLVRERVSPLQRTDEPVAMTTPLRSQVRSEFSEAAAWRKTG